jgi:hypothetical protein
MHSIAIALPIRSSCFRLDLLEARVMNAGHNVVMSKNAKAALE